MDEIYGVQKGTCTSDSTMIRVIRICRKCGAKIFSDVPEGLCPRCVLKSALGNFADGSVAGGDLSAVASAKADDTGRSDTLQLLMRIERLTTRNRRAPPSC
jgi:hypothetical protein